MKLKKWLSLFLAAALVCSLTACGTASKKSDMVVLDVTSEPTDLNPIRLSEVISQSIVRHTMSGLMRLNAQDVPVGDLAESWEISEDKKVYTMHLRKDGKWSNGDPVTAHDFYFAWTTQLKKDSGSVMVFLMTDNIRNAQAFYDGEVGEDQLGFKALDDYTFQIEWERPMVSGMFLLTMPNFFPVNQKVYEEIGADAYAKEVDQMVTNGPYHMTEWVHNDHILLEKNSDYYDAEAVTMPTVKLTMMGDANARLNSFLAGEIDLCSLYSEQIGEVEKNGKNLVRNYSDGGSWYLCFNQEDPFLSNINMRKALAHAIDIQSLLDNVIADGSIAADGLVPDSISSPDGKRYTETRGSLFAYDPEEAKAYLEQALTELGITADQVTVSLSAYDTTYSQTQATYFQQQWKEKLGLDVELKIMPSKAFSEVKQSGDYQIVCDAWAADTDDAYSFLGLFVQESPNNIVHYSNDTYTELVRKANVETDIVKRQDLLIQAERILMEDMVVGPLYFTRTSYAVTPKLEKLVRTPYQFFSVYNGPETTTP